MRNIVTFDEYSEVDLRPEKLINDYVRLVEEDISAFFLERECLRYSPCPGCLEKEISSSFMRFGLNYVECAKCHSLRISPRPEDAALRTYYLESSAREFWRQKLSRMTKIKRREKIVKPRYEWIADSTYEYYPDARHILDINTNQEIILDEISSAELFKRKTIVDPLIPVDETLFPKIDVILAPFSDMDLAEDVDVITLFEVLDHISDVEAFFRKLHGMLKRGGLCFVTTILCSGFDIQILWDKAQNLFPPDRLNVFSAEGLKSLFLRHGFKCLEFSTPGVLDVEIVAKAVEQNSSADIPKFVRYLIENRDPSVRRDFQEFLEASLLSSYGRILIQKN